MSLNTPQLERALQHIGKHLQSASATQPIRMYLIGGAAGMLRGWLGPDRSTGDIDVTAIVPLESWNDVRSAAAAVADELGLVESWLNDDCRAFAWALPLGWQDRCDRSGVFGPLEVWVLDRRDFIALKVVSGPARPQDQADVRALVPTASELEFVELHIDRLEAEHLDPDRPLDGARAILQSLRGAS